MKQVINVALWSVAYFVAFLAAECIGFIHPFCYLFFGLFAAVLCAWPYAKLCQNHPVSGMALVCVATVIIIYTVMGEVSGFKLLFVWGGLALGLVAEIIAALAGERGSQMNIALSYLPLSLIPFASTAFMWQSPTHMYAETIEEMGTEYADAMQPLFLSWLNVAMILVTLAVAYGCAMLCTRGKK